MINFLVALKLQGMILVITFIAIGLVYRYNSKFTKIKLKKLVIELILLNAVVIVILFMFTGTQKVELTYSENFELKEISVDSISLINENSSDNIKLKKVRKEQKESEEESLSEFDNFLKTN